MTAARPFTLIERLTFAIAAATSAALVWKALARADLSFDLSDQGAYFNAISRPFDFPLTVSQYGFIYHPLYLLFGGAIAALRQASFLLTFGLAIVTTWSAIRLIARRDDIQRKQTGHLSAMSGAQIVVIASVCALNMMFINAMWLPGPSYNSLNYQALLVTATGFCLADKRLNLASGAGWTLLAAGGVLAFLAKPTTAAVLGLLIPIALLVDRRLSWRGLLVSATVAIALMAAAMHVIGGSIPAFVDGVRQAAKSSSTLVSTLSASGVLRIDAFRIGGSGFGNFCTLFVAVVLLIACAASRHSILRSLASLALLAVAVLALLLATDTIDARRGLDESRGLYFYALPLAALAGAVLLQRRAFFASASAGAVLFLALCPLAYVFGTTANYWQAGATASFFFVLAAYGCLARGVPQAEAQRRTAPVAIAALAMTAFFVQQGVANPYRDYFPLEQSTVPVRLGPTPSTLRLNPQLADYLQGITRIAADAGFVRDTPVIDMTGHHPGTLFALGAKPLGGAWLIGGYPGSGTVAGALLAQLPCAELARAWILDEPKGLRRLPTSVLAHSGLDLERDYAVVGTIESPATSFKQTFMQALLKPARPASDMIAACRAAREDASRK